MNIRIVIVLFACSMLNLSCIDRDTIAGTGKEAPDRMIGAGGDFQSGIIRTQLPIPLRVRILAANGRPVRGVVVEFSNSLERVSFSDTTARSDGDGYASTRVTFGTVADSIQVNASVLGIKGSPIVFHLVARAAAEENAEIESGDAQSGVVSGPLSSPLMVKVTDPYNNPVKNVVAEYSTNNGRFSSSFVQTDSFGIASSIWFLDTLIGQKTASVTFPSLPGVVLNFKATATAHTPYNMYAALNDSIHAMEGQPLPGGLRVKMVDKFGNPAKQQSVRFSVVLGSPGIDTARAFQTGTDGVATVSITLAFGDSVEIVNAYSPYYPLPVVPFHITSYRYSQLSSISSSGGNVELGWDRNVNNNFVSYNIERCLTYTFDQSTVALRTITDQNIVSITDTSAVIGTSPFYRVKINYLNNFYFYTNIRQITVQP
ncbi:MAG: hypothetical protein M0R68_06425 [Bacteroidetes bacterium]|nr:hypothetical protein [Bacteroidota bacterium]